MQAINERFKPYFFRTQNRTIAIDSNTVVWFGSYSVFGPAIIDRNAVQTRMGLSGFKYLHYGQYGHKTRENTTENHENCLALCRHEIISKMHKSVWFIQPLDLPPEAR